MKKGNGPRRFALLSPGVFSPGRGLGLPPGSVWEPGCCSPGCQQGAPEGQRGRYQYCGLPRAKVLRHPDLTSLGPQSPPPYNDKMGEPHPSGYSGLPSPRRACQHGKQTPNPRAAEREEKIARSLAPHLCTPVNSFCSEPLAPETTSLETPGGPLEPQPPAVPSWAGQVPFCSSLRQPNLPNQRAWEGGNPSSCHPRGQRALSKSLAAHPHWAHRFQSRPSGGP